MSADQVTVRAALPTIPRQSLGAGPLPVPSGDVLLPPERLTGTDGRPTAGEDLSSAGSWIWETDGEVVRWPPVIHRILGTLDSPDAADDLDESQALAERGYAHMFELAQGLATAVGDTVAAKLPQGGPATGGGGLAAGH